LSAGSFLPGGYVLGVVNNTPLTPTRSRRRLGWRAICGYVKSRPEAYYHIQQNSWGGKRGASGATVRIEPDVTCTDPAPTSAAERWMRSFVVDWRFAKRFDAYAGVVYSQVANGLRRLPCQGSWQRHSNRVRRRPCLKFNF